MARAVGVRRASQRKGWKPPTPEELAERAKTQEQRQRDLAEQRETDSLTKPFTLAGLPLTPIPTEQLGQPTRLDPMGLTKGGGYWIAELAKTGRRVEAGTFTQDGQLNQPDVYPCKCDESRAKSYRKAECSRKWCECSGRPIPPHSREDRELPQDCCARSYNSVASLRAEQDELEIAKRSLIAQNKVKADNYAKGLVVTDNGDRVAVETHDGDIPQEAPETQGGERLGLCDTQETGGSSMGRKESTNANGEEPAENGQIRAGTSNQGESEQPANVSNRTDGSHGRVGEWRNTGAGLLVARLRKALGVSEGTPGAPKSGGGQYSGLADPLGERLTTYLDRREDYLDDLAEQQSVIRLRATYNQLLSEAKDRIAKETCTCKTPWDGERRNASTGIHCVACHENFHTIMGYEMHIREGGKTCIDPSSVIDRKEWGGTGQHLLKLGVKNGCPIWVINRPT